MPIVPPTRPPYKNVPSAVLLMLWHLARGAPASLTLIQERLFAGMTPSPSVRGQEFIPTNSPFVAVFNHYENEHIAAWWGPLLMTRIIADCRAHAIEHGELRGASKDRPGGGLQRHPSAVRWLMAREWWYPPGFGRLVKQPLTRLLFGRIAQVYGFVLVPPVLDGDLTRGEGVAGVRRALALTRGEHPALVGLAPEGHSGPGGVLEEPPAGVGLFLLLLTHNTIPLLPVGWFQDEQGVLRINFGRPFRLTSPRAIDRHARDRAVVIETMVAIGRLLPERLWGTYRAETGRQGDGETR